MYLGSKSPLAESPCPVKMRLRTTHGYALYDVCIVLLSYTVGLVISVIVALFICDSISDTGKLRMKKSEFFQQKPMLFYKLSITSSRALPLSCNRLVGATQLNKNSS